jgi:hypothetical protein
MKFFDIVEVEGEKQKGVKSLAVEEDKALAILIDPEGEVHSRVLGPTDYVINCGPRRYISSEQLFPTSGTAQLTLKVDR